MKVNDLKLTKDELLQAITYFVERQELVAQALKDFGLDLYAIAILGAGGWLMAAEGAKELYEVLPDSFEANFKNALQRMIENKTPKVDQTGIWKDQDGETWNYFMHGGGCQLRNPITGEIIDWDCPDTKYFDPFKFAFHLKWQIEKYPEKYSNLVSFLSQNDIDTIDPSLIPELANEGKLIKDLTNLYRVS